MYHKFLGIKAKTFALHNHVFWVVTQFGVGLYRRYQHWRKQNKQMHNIKMYNL